MIKSTSLYRILARKLVGVLKGERTMVNFADIRTPSPTDNDGVACMHGPEECMGNIIELCAADL